MNDNPTVLFCPACDGKGKLRSRKCDACRGLGIASFSRGRVRFWKYPITRYSLSHNKIGRIFNKVRFITVVILGLNAWFWSGVYFYRSLDAHLLSLKDAWQYLPNVSETLFYVGLVLFAYAYYRALVQRPHHSEVAHFDYDAKDNRKIEDWQKISSFGHRMRSNISNAFTEEALSAIERAYEIADKDGGKKLEPVHMFAALLESNRIANTFIRLGIPTSSIVAEMKNESLFIGAGMQKEPPVFSDDFYRTLFDAYELAYRLHQNYVSVTELLIASVNHSKPLEDLLFNLNIDKRRLMNVVSWARIRERMTRDYAALSHGGNLRSKYGMDRAMTAVATQFLNRMSTDLTRQAQLMNLDACVARDNEMDEIFQVIEGGGNNLLLVGDYGVGKRTIIYGLAEKMVAGDVPDRLKDKRLVSLSLSGLLSGTTPSGAIERLVMCLNEVARARNVILFIHNLHELLGVSAGQDNTSFDVASTLAEYLSSGRFLVFATTTPEAYGKAINNSKLSTVFTKLDIKEMDNDQAIEALESKVAYIEYKENVFFAYDALDKAVQLSRKFLRDQTLPSSAIELVTEAAVLARSKKGASSLVTGEEVNTVVVEKTHIPLTAVSTDESAKLLHLEEEMHHRVIGQDEAVKLVASALRRARAEIRSQSKPIANFLFLGPTGVGKTELAKTIAEVYFGGEARMIRLDMSEYQDKSSIYRLIGAPGEKGTGILTEAVHRQPFALLLLDEIEKADKDVLNLFLQVMDDGRLTDSVGRVVDFTNIIIIATSNAGTSFVQEQMKAGVLGDQIKDRLLHGELKSYFRPEFLNRFDGIVLFEPLSEKAVKQISELLLKRIGNDLEAKGIKLEVRESAVDYLSHLGFDPEFGARPLRRVLQEKVENQLAELILSGNLKRRSTVVLEGEGEIHVI